MTRPNHAAGVAAIDASLGFTDHAAEMQASAKRIGEILDRSTAREARVIDAIQQTYAAASDAKRALDAQ